MVRGGVLPLCWGVPKYKGDVVALVDANPSVTCLGLLGAEIHDSPVLPLPQPGPPTGPSRGMTFF
ncbi:hypothetical protein E2C01_001153 [Portunus trituberculatus]|uniref:Uncharacterized protein n=1 Tax=Portunus trituberculatus TaxID=210409 RepID=A0A5B7CH32_PORTR|nr:hypothetical protein [Portunus trituberculatus]